MRILITGITGYVGSHLVNELANFLIYDIYGVVRSLNSIPSNYTPVLVDDNLEENILLINPDIVIHLASYLTSNYEWRDVVKLIDSNIVFSTRILHSLRGTSCKYFINIGTFAEYHYSDGELIPTYVYAATKTAFRSMIKYYSTALNFKTIHIIPYTIYGGTYKQQKIIDLLIKSVNSKVPINLSEGFQKLDFIHIKDVCSFFISLISTLSTSNNIKNDEVFYLGSGKPYSIREVADMIERNTGKKLSINWGAVKPREMDTVYACAYIDKCLSLIGWEPRITLEDEIKQLKF